MASSLNSIHSQLRKNKSGGKDSKAVARMARCLRDERQAGKVDHSLQDLFKRRVFSIAYGYAESNDSARLGADPIHKPLLDRDPVPGLDLASQPTYSAFFPRRPVRSLQLDSTIYCPFLCPLPFDPVRASN
jgi:hypothetical protein